MKPIAVQLKDVHAVPFISDSTIRFEMSIFGAIMDYALKKRYVPASQRFNERPNLKTMRGDEFTLEEYRKLHTVGRKWIAEADKPSSVWYRTITYNMILIACNTGMRPAEMKKLLWCDIMPAKDRVGREIVVLYVQGKGIVAQAGRAQERRGLFRTHPHKFQSHGTGWQGVHHHHGPAREDSV